MPLWYASYGSNLAQERFACYLAGGTPDGAGRCMPGARDQTPPLDERPAVLPGEVFFGWESPTWGGGVAFLDANASGRALARAYLISEEQFADVASQEMHREPGEDIDLEHVMEHGRHSLGPGRYETLHFVGDLEGDPVLTFTARHPSDLAPNAPSAAYLATMARGIAQTHGLAHEEITDYLLARRGMEDWEPEAVAQVVSG
jgi:hypothetical protein